ncbi:hypothetical protein IWQ60_003486 [Tieghemiomyces parasiticus]|uniref:RRM domain-containing protein n=1 Tax=Tieghemiomyces parasiticus TaxID=78921 RepID=A0A9W8E003_9FUNG|nr:hypothetical protein IWQ60_003486 [Tieghemiomyces parasiticus]
MPTPAIRFSLPVFRLQKFTQTDHLLSYFSQFGRIIQFRLFRDPSTRQCTGAGRVVYSNVQDAQKVLDQQHHLVPNLKFNVTVREDFTETEKPDRFLDDFGFTDFKHFNSTRRTQQEPTKEDC